MKYLILLFSVIFIGCSSSITIPEKQYIPIKCKINKPSIPVLTNSLDELNFKKIYDDNTSILVYSEVINKDLIFCIEGVTNDK